MNYQNQYKPKNQYKQDQTRNRYQSNKDYQPPSNANPNNDQRHEESAPETPTHNNADRIVRSIMIAKSNVFLRKGPGKENDPICTISKGSKVHRLDTREYGSKKEGINSKEKWIRAEYGPNSLTGFICEEFLVPDETSEILEEPKKDAEG